MKLSHQLSVNSKQLPVYGLQFFVCGFQFFFSCFRVLTIFKSKNLEKLSKKIFSNTKHQTSNIKLKTVSCKLLTVNCLLFIVNCSLAQDSLKLQELNEIVVKSTRANAKTGMAFTNLYQKEIKKQNLGQDLPFLLNQLPSVVISSDAGAGVGYTGIRIRGTDPTRINVTLNGIPYNDSESQGVYWVNMPDFSSSVASIQIQRGVGTSTNGAGAFGASININTLGFEQNPFGEINTSIGSYNTLKTNILASTGLLNNHFIIDARLSKIASEGFIDRASSNLKSFYISSGWYGKNSFVRLNIFSGKEVTYQAWEGVPESAAKGDLKGMNEYVERNGYDNSYLKELQNRGRKFNPYTYENQVDDYQQDNYQLVSSFKINKNLTLNPTFHYTYGRGFYEQYKEADKFKNYGLPDVKNGTELIKKTDFIRRKRLDNHFYGIVYSLDYQSDSKFSGTLGGGWNKYDGDHFGEIIWAKYAPEKGYRWYESNAQKTDFNVFGKGFYQVSEKLNFYGDLQIRTVKLDMAGTGDKRQNISQKADYQFFSPKFGLNYLLNEKASLYGSFAIGNKEPSRQDFVDNPNKVPESENLKDLEMGFKFQDSKFGLEGNFYNMIYKNQLVLTGQVNGVGEAIRVNVPNSYRAGLELIANYKFAPKFVLSGNATFSQNKIKDFTETIVSYDATPDKQNKFSKTDISFSPNLISGGQLSYFSSKNLEISWLSKYVGKQFLDNTSSENKKLDAFFVNDLRINYSIKPKFLKEIGLSLLVNNIFNHQYESNGYTYSYIFEKVITENFLYPQAGTNFLLAAKIRF